MATRVIPMKSCWSRLPGDSGQVEEAIARDEEIAVVVARALAGARPFLRRFPIWSATCGARQRDLLDLVRSIATMALITRAEQRQPLGFGHAVAGAAAIGD